MDEGTYELAMPLEGDLKKQETELFHQLHSGEIKFKLKGKKLKGEYTLVKAHGKRVLLI